MPAFASLTRSAHHPTHTSTALKILGGVFCGVALAYLLQKTLSGGQVVLLFAAGIMLASFSKRLGGLL